VTCRFIAVHTRGVRRFGAPCCGAKKERVNPSYRFFRMLNELILYFEAVKPLPSMRASPGAVRPCGRVQPADNRGD
jgi:hypothetical protein